MSRVSSCGSGSLVTLLATSCQLVPNPALLGGEASTGVDAASSSSSAGMDGVGTTGPADTSTTGPADSSTSGPADASTTGPADSSTTGPAEELWCMDVDADGFGDPAACMQAGTMPAGTVNNDDDCDDGSPDTFPGAAPNDDPLACMRDADGDDWGDASPDIAGPVGGSDCHDTNPDLNPGTLQLAVLTPHNGSPGDSRMLQTVDPNTAALTPFVTLQDPLGNIPNIDVSSATMDANGMIFANDFGLNELHTVSYADTCGGETGVVTPLGSYAPLTSVSGLELAGNGTLYGISNDDHLYTFDPITGQVIDDIPLALDVGAVGMAYDCAQDRLLFASGIDQSIYRIDPATGAVTLLRDLSADLGPVAWNTVGLAWDPVSRTAYLSTGAELYNVDIDDALAPPVNRGTFGPQPVSNLAYLPICSP